VDDRKVVCRRVRLLRLASTEELAALRIWSSGEHIAGELPCVAHGSAVVRAYGSATVRAYDSATVQAYDSATVVSWWGKPGIHVNQLAIWIERGNGFAAPVIHVAEAQS